MFPLTGQIRKWRTEYEIQHACPSCGLR